RTEYAACRHCSVLLCQRPTSLTLTCQVSGYSLTDDSYATVFGSTTLYKDSLKNQFSINLDASRKTTTLNGLNMQPADTAVYYCAREPQ
uniref:Immunoglobulin V-set domain-containing protein n=1 Tax=Labrus bergylta TaxID=56723 RepID=A0A3Q3GRS3_9LABR